EGRGPIGGSGKGAQDDRRQHWQLDPEGLELRASHAIHVSGRPPPGTDDPAPLTYPAPKRAGGATWVGTLDGADRSDWTHPASTTPPAWSGTRRPRSSTSTWCAGARAGSPRAGRSSSRRAATPGALQSQSTSCAVPAAGAGCGGGG